jgi:hypothetical protein
MDEQELLRRIAENQASGLGPHPGREAPNPALQGGVLGQFMPPREDHTDEAKTALQAVLMALPTPAIGGILGKILGQGARLQKAPLKGGAAKAAEKQARDFIERRAVARSTTQPILTEAERTAQRALREADIPLEVLQARDAAFKRANPFAEVGHAWTQFTRGARP